MSWRTPADGKPPRRRRGAARATGSPGATPRLFPGASLPPLQDFQECATARYPQAAEAGTRNSDRTFPIHFMEIFQMKLSLATVLIAGIVAGGLAFAQDK